MFTGFFHKPSGMKYGRKPRQHDPRVKFLVRETPADIPSSVDYSQGLPQMLGMMLNNSLGDCTAAAVGHAIQVWSYNATGTLVTPTDEQVESLYEATGGYVPGDPSTDNGADEQTVLKYWLNNPVDDNKLSAFAEVSGDIESFIFECGVVYIGFNVPAFLTNLESPGSVWDVNSKADNAIIGGHAVIAVGFDSDNYTVISWGSRYTMTRAFYNQFVDEVYALVDAEWVKATGKTPAGMTLTQLEELVRPMKPTPWRHRHHRRQMKRRR